jgi:tripartite-type tricarboxylate transporter receptor subunit TctC
MQILWLRLLQDGYTLLLAVLPQMAVLPAMTKTNYDPVKDFSLITVIASNEFALSVANQFPANNFRRNSLAM